MRLMILSAHTDSRQNKIIDKDKSFEIVFPRGSTAYFSSNRTAWVYIRFMNIDEVEKRTEPGVTFNEVSKVMEPESLILVLCVSTSIRVIRSSIAGNRIWRSIIMTLEYRTEILVTHSPG